MVGFYTRGRGRQRKVIPITARSGYRRRVMYWEKHPTTGVTEPVGKPYDVQPKKETPEGIFGTLEKKLKTIKTKEEFNEVQNWWMGEMMRVGSGPTMRKIEDISQERYGVPPTTTKLFLKVRGESLTLYKKEKITLDATGVPVLLSLKKDEEALDISKNIIDFIAKKYPGEELEIRIGHQPISVAGRKGFRIGIPPKEAPIGMMFPYSMKVGREFEELEKRSHPSRTLWATMDFFHELAHTKGISDEKEADRFALKLTKEYLQGKKRRGR